MSEVKILCWLTYFPSLFSIAILHFTKNELRKFSVSELNYGALHWSDIPSKVVMGEFNIL